MTEAEYYTKLTVGLITVLAIMGGMITFFIKRYLDDDKEFKREIKDAFLELKELVIRHDQDIAAMKKRRG